MITPHDKHKRPERDDDYYKFLARKIRFDHALGFEISADQVNPLLKPHQRDIVVWAVRGGRRAIFAAFGLGKTFIQLEIMRLIGEREGGYQLQIAPLGVRQEFRRDSAKLGIDITFIRRTEEIDGPGLYLTNYESVRDKRLDINHFNAVSLDEASVLRSYGSLTFQTFLTEFTAIKYRFAATATPSPNRFKELIHYAGFLGIMDTGQALTRFFKRDSSKANNLTLYPHKEREFWLWVSSWAIFLQRPSDLGYSDEGYDLPPLRVHYHEVNTDPQILVGRDGQLGMFADAALSLKDAASAKRSSMSARIDKMKEILDADPGSHYLLWHDQEAERHAIRKAHPEAVEVYGSLDLDTREQRIMDFSDGKTPCLATKPILSGSGCNFQRYCHNAIFVGIGFKFNDFIQAIHRIYRFLQDHECVIHLIYADTEREILKTLEKKWEQHKAMVKQMSEIIRKYGLAATDMADELRRAIGVERIEISGEHFIAANNDTVVETRDMATESVDLIVTSIPFANHYEYTPSYNDMGHTENNAQFWAQMDFLTPELLRVLKPGRVYACHVKDRILFGNVTGMGMPTSSPFHAETIFHAQKHGFAYMGMITVVTDVVRENNQTYRLGWTEQCKDGSKMGVGSPEYILLFRKLPTDTTKGYADVKVVKQKAITEGPFCPYCGSGESHELGDIGGLCCDNCGGMFAGSSQTMRMGEGYSRARWQVDAHAFWRSSGDRHLSTDELSRLGPDVLAKVFTEQSLQRVYNHEAHVRIGEALEIRGALPAKFMAIAPGSHHPAVWHDVNRMRTLNGSQSQKGLNQHVCPLQIDIVNRLITRYSNPGELVYDPFGGLMTVPYCAVKLSRKGRGAELNHDYFMDGITYLQAAEMEVSMPTLFDLEAAQ